MITDKKINTDETTSLDERCDKCGEDDLYYYGVSEYGVNGICNSCMINKMIIQDGRLVDQ